MQIMTYNLKQMRFVLTFVMMSLIFVSGAAYAQSTLTPTPCQGPPDWTTTINPYAGLYKNPESLFQAPQFPDLAPGDQLITQNNLPVAPNLQPCDKIDPATNSDPFTLTATPLAWKDPVWTYAAYMFCSMSAPKPKNPLYDVPGVIPGTMPSSGKISMTGAQVYAFANYEQISHAASIVYSHCMSMVQRRLSYGSKYGAATSSGTDSASGCNPGDMNCQQKAACLLLKSPMNGAVNAAGIVSADSTSLGSSSSTGSGMPAGPANSGSGDSGSGSGDSGSSSAAPNSTPNYGHGITHLNNTDLDGILASCDGNDTDAYAGGMSQEAHDAIWAHRCDDANYASALNSSSGSGAKGQEAVDKCHAEAKEYDKEVRDDITKLEGEILALQALENNMNAMAAKHQ